MEFGPLFRGVEVFYSGDKNEPGLRGPAALLRFKKTKSSRLGAFLDALLSKNEAGTFLVDGAAGFEPANDGIKIRCLTT